MANKAVFLDRDGVINKKREDHVKSVNEFEIFPDVGQSIKKLKRKNYLVIVITNQSIIGKKIITYSELEKIHGKLKDYLKKYDTFVDSIYVCPHLPEDNCICRKPKPGLVLKAIQDFDIDLKRSWVIGDSHSDMMVAGSVNCKGILLEKNIKLCDVIEKYIV